MMHLSSDHLISVGIPDCIADEIVAYEALLHSVIALPSGRLEDRMDGVERVIAALEEWKRIVSSSAIIQAEDGELLREID